MGSAILVLLSLDVIFRIYQYIRYKRLNKKFFNNFKNVWDGVFNEIKVNNSVIEEARQESDKKYMELQLKNKLEAEEECRKIDEETLEALRRLQDC